MKTKSDAANRITRTEMKLFIVQWNPNKGLWMCPHYDRVWAESAEQAEKPYLDAPHIHLTGPTQEADPYPKEIPPAPPRIGSRDTPERSTDSGT